MNKFSVEIQSPVSRSASHPGIPLGGISVRTEQGASLHSQMKAAVVAPVQSGKLPPLPALSSGVETHPTRVVLLQATEDVQGAMKHLLSEVMKCYINIL